MRKILALLFALLLLAGCAWNPPTDDTEVARNFWHNHQPLIVD